MTHAETIKYTSVISIIQVNSADGDDELTFDDVTAQSMLVTSGYGDDKYVSKSAHQSIGIELTERWLMYRFIVGQLYAASHDEFGVSTELTTRGWISNGVSVGVSLFGGPGNDAFLLQRNLVSSFIHSFTFIISLFTFLTRVLIKGSITCVR
jgi:hypothetical protein